MSLYLTLSLATLTIYVPSQYRTVTGTMKDSVNICTAVMISKNTALTADHCIEDITGSIAVEHSKKAIVKIIKKDAVRDLALLQVLKVNKPYVKLGPEPYITERVYTVNSGQGHENTYDEGIIQNIDKDDPDDAQVHIQDSIHIAQGASGSGLFNAKGELIGINVISMETGSLAVDTLTIRNFLK